MTETITLPEPWASEAQFYQRLAGEALGHAVALLAAREGLTLETIEPHRQRLHQAAAAELERVGEDLGRALRAPRGYFERTAVTWNHAVMAFEAIIADYRTFAEPPAGAHLN